MLVRQLTEEPGDGARSPRRARPHQRQVTAVRTPITTLPAPDRALAPGPQDHHGRPWEGLAVGCFYLCMAGVHIGLVASDPQVYDGFGEQGLFAFVREGWDSVFMAAPAVWASLLLVGELLIGALLVVGGRWAVWGWTAVVLFHLLLLLFGWWVWLYVVPALAVVLLLARRDLARGGRR